MSRMGKSPIPLPKGVSITEKEQGTIEVQGPKGKLPLNLPKDFRLHQEGEEVFIRANSEEVSALHGLYRALLKNAILGVFEGYEVKLNMIGVGYRANVVGSKLDLQVGHSHPTLLDIPQGIEVVVEKGTMISVRGIDKRAVGQFAASIRRERPPEPYKGKGIRYENEYVRKKEGKAAKGKGA